MSVLIFGASGTIGKSLFQVLSKEYEIYGTYNQNKPLDSHNDY